MSSGTEKLVLFTVGHSNHELNAFVELLRTSNVTAIADVRSSPYSQYAPQFNQDLLKTLLPGRGIEYHFLGRELGARREEAACYRNGRVDYRLVPQTALFQQGLSLLGELAERSRAALMCSEKDPIECHRMVLVCREIRTRFDLRHIRPDGSAETQCEVEQRLLRATGQEEAMLFGSDEERLANAYDAQGDRISYRPTPEDAPVEKIA